MRNYWFIPRPKRKLIPVPEIFSAFIAGSLHSEWSGEVGKHLSFEEELEKQGLKRKGDRRDQGGSGGRTYGSWLFSLGLYLEKNGRVYPTLAGESLINGEPPIEILKHQVLKFQYPSSYSTRSRVNISKRFRIRPFRFILKLISDSRIDFLTQEELAKIVITEAEDESDKCYEHIVSRIIDFRNYGDSILSEDFNERYFTRSGIQTLDKTIASLQDIANTFINWIEYTQLAARDSGELRIIPGKKHEVNKVLSDGSGLILRWDEEEYFQRRFGVDPWHMKDTRNLNKTATVTADNIARKMVRAKFLSMAAKSPITVVDEPIIEEIYYSTGITHDVVAEELASFSMGALDSFEASYYDMALKGRERARDFELATVELLVNAFGFNASHVGDKGKHPDVLAKSDQYSGIIDTKAYASYSITNDHKNRMTHNYIPYYQNKYNDLEFFMYIAGGFGSNFDQQILSTSQRSKIDGCGITTNNILKLARKYKDKNWTHDDLNKLFRINRELKSSDFI